MQTKHTPGPWHIGVRTFHAGRDVYVPKGEPVAVADDAITATPEAEANARLIAAAPDMLAALRELVVNNMGHPKGITVPQLDKARAAIAKATGGQP